MSLFRLKIDGNPFDESVTYTEAQLNGNAPYVIAGSNPDAANYDDITSMQNLHLLGSKSGKDSIFVSAEVKALFEAKTGADESEKWGNCTDEEKDCLAKLFIVSPSLVAERIADSNVRKYYFGELVKSAVPDRQARIEKAIAVIGEELTTKADRVDLYNAVKSPMSSYVASGDADIIDYMNSEGNYDVTTGFESKSYYTATIKALFNLIVRDGE